MFGETLWKIMPNIEIYTRPGCSYCNVVKRLLTNKNAPYVELDIWSDPGVQAEMQRRTKGARSVPQIIIGGVAVGGADDLFALERSGKLDELLAA
jgi:glutaredoxin 3